MICHVEPPLIRRSGWNRLASGLRWSSPAPAGLFRRLRQISYRV